VRRAFFLAAALAGGCGPGVASVSGVVTYHGQPVPVGTITFFGADHRTASAPLGSDGRYQCDDVPTGPVRVAVGTPAPPPAHGEGLPQPPPLPVQDPHFPAQMVSPPPARVVPVPRRYADPATSGLSLEVGRGGRTFDVSLSD
jgi:hypothetical protein